MSATSIGHACGHSYCRWHKYTAWKPRESICYSSCFKQSVFVLSTLQQQHHHHHQQQQPQQQQPKPVLAKYMSHICLQLLVCLYISKSTSDPHSSYLLDPQLAFMSSQICSYLVLTLDLGPNALAPLSGVQQFTMTTGRWRIDVSELLRVRSVWRMRGEELWVDLIHFQSGQPGISRSFDRVPQ